MRDLCMIACVSRDGGLGKEGKLLWQIPEDMQFFRHTTQGGVVAMGRKTFTSIGRALPGRTNLVLSRHPVEATDVIWCDSVEMLNTKLTELAGRKFIIGGASLYQLFLPEAEEIYLTEVDGVKPADTYFPEFDKSKFVRAIVQTGVSDGVKYEMVRYSRA